MSKKSGLADSPIFSNPAKPKHIGDSPTPTNPKDTHLQNGEVGVDEAKNKPKRTSVQSYRRSVVQVNSRTGVQKNKRTSVRDFRAIKRNAYSLYVDQINFIEDEVLRRKRQMGKSVGISDVMREIVGYYISKKKK